MKAQKRMYICVSLLLTCALGVPSHMTLANVREHEEVLEDEIELSGNGISDNKIEELQQVSGNEREASENAFLETENDADKNSKNTITSENLYVDEKEKKSLSVVLPTEIPCHMVLYENRKHKGLISSTQFFIENRGYEDVVVFLEGFCQGKDGDNYVFSDAPVDKTIVQGKKNAYVCLKWENENGDELGLPRMIMGDAANPGTAEIVLSAPIRDENGEIAGDNLESKAYFSFMGELNSDTGEEWKSNELQFDLNYSIETIISKNKKASVNPTVLPNDIKIPDHSNSPEALETILSDDEAEKAESISENSKNVQEDLENVSGNSDSMKVEKELDIYGGASEPENIITGSENAVVRYGGR